LCSLFKERSTCKRRYATLYHILSLIVLYVLIFPHRRNCRNYLLFPHVLLRILKLYLDFWNQRNIGRRSLKYCVRVYQIELFCVTKKKAKDIAFVYTMKKWEYTIFKSRRFISLLPLNLMVDFHLMP
jgi:hypothetical protein